MCNNPFLDMISCCPFLNLKRKVKKSTSRQPSQKRELVTSPQSEHPISEITNAVVKSEPPETVTEPLTVDNSTRLMSVSSEGEFFDAKSDFSATATSAGQVVSRENSTRVEETKSSESWHPSFLWGIMGWTSGRSSSMKSIRKRRSLQLERNEEQAQPRETDSAGSSDQDQTRSASTTTVDANGQSRMFTVISNLMHHSKEASSSQPQSVGHQLICGSTFQRREETVSHDEASERWEPADATHYKIRSKTYLRSRIKEECKGAFYEVFESDLFSFEKKQTHVAQHIHLPVDPYKRTAEEKEAIAEYGLPTLLIVNMQLPVYQPSLFGACDGPGHSFVFHCVLREHFNPRTFQNQAALGLFQRFVRDCKNQSLYRIKLIPKFLNVDEWAEKGPLSPTEHRLVHQFNEKPILTRPYQHFYHEAHYFEIDVDVHSWLYVARKAFWTLLPRMHKVITEVAMLIQGNSPDDLPEHIIAVARVYRVNLTKFRYLSDLLKQPADKRPTDPDQMTSSPS